MKTDLKKKILGSQMETAKDIGERELVPLWGEAEDVEKDEGEKSKEPQLISIFVTYFPISHSKDEKPLVRSPESLLWEMR